MTPRALPLLALLTLLGAQAPARAADTPPAPSARLEGRLFLSPQKRALLDEMRRNRVRIGPLREESESVRLDGIVRRSQGPATLWINGRPYTDRDAPVTRSDERSARIITGERGGVELKVGETRKTGNAATP